ncbi:hypothetical protein LTR53_001515 [Teratosphaeriaceae sp. CCFEE 6253]|nr:hypothetical protein LTR53_001515 [Teratosphaeriaceae sp. CCFEE 6253]
MTPTHLLTVLRHALGLRLRALRPPLAPVPEVPRGSHSDLLAAGLPRGGQTRQLQALRQAAWLARECRNRAEGGASSHPDESSDGASRTQAATALALADASCRWKSLFPVGAHVTHVNGVTKDESTALRDWFKKLCVDNHDLQVRFKWQDANHIAIGDNRSVFHNATYDFDGLGDRHGNRAVGLGEKPFFDPESRSRREALEADGAVVGKPFMAR